MLVGTYVHDGAEFQLHLHVVPHERDDFREFVGFRDALRDDPVLREGYVAAKRSVLEAAHGPVDGRRYSTAKSPFVEDALFSHGIRRAPADAPEPLAPGATIGILGGGQLGRMLALAARTLGYRVAILDPDPACPAAAVADEVIVGGYGDTEAALRLADVSASGDVRAGARRAIGPWPRSRHASRSGRVSTTLRVTQDRLAERRFLHGRGEPVAPWRAVTDAASTTGRGRGAGLSAAPEGGDRRLRRAEPGADRRRRPTWMPRWPSSAGGAGPADAAGAGARRSSAEVSVTVRARPRRPDGHVPGRAQPARPRRAGGERSRPRRWDPWSPATRWGWRAGSRAASTSSGC